MQYSLSYSSHTELEWQHFTSFRSTVGLWDSDECIQSGTKQVWLIIQFVAQRCTVLKHAGGAYNTVDDSLQLLHMTPTAATLPTLAVDWLDLDQPFWSQPFKYFSLTGRRWWLKRGYEGSKARSQYVQCMDVKQGSADKERVWSAKQLTLINKSKNTTAEAEACKVNGWETISTLRRLL